MSEWISVEEFQEEPNEGWCWIVYKGRVTEAYHNHKAFFLFHQHSQNCFMTECISYVRPMVRPEAPKLREDKDE